MKDAGSCDVVVVGAGAVGAATAYFAARAGLRVVVVDRGPIGGGTSSAGEGNVLVSDKDTGPELDLARHSQRVWREELAEHGHHWEFESKGGVVVASTDGSLAALRALADRQRAAGVRVDDLGPSELADVEPLLRPGLAGGAAYPEDAQVQPVLLVAHLLRLARAAGARVLTGTPVTEIRQARGRLLGVTTPAGRVDALAVVNAAGTWAGEVAALAGVHLPVLPRRGFVLVTEPLPPLAIRHKVYAAEYVGDVGSSDAALQSSPVVEGTPAGTVLIGSTRERVGFDSRPSREALALLARGAIGLFPALAGVRALRAYHGFRPYCPDHL
ncbi:NAD(P)/FAD-dependent oxidoreductase, partial [Streptomyces hainanensis]